MLVVFSSRARILFDTGSTHSFIAASFVLALGLHVEPMDCILSVVSPLGGEVDACTICRGCVVGIEGHDLVADLVVLDMVGYDIVLGMDWMSAYHATVDCHKKRVTISPPGGPVIVFSGGRLLPVCPCGAVRSWALSPWLVCGRRTVLW